jgi:hypothetical protein
MPLGLMLLMLLMLLMMMTRMMTWQRTKWVMRIQQTSSCWWHWLGWEDAMGTGWKLMRVPGRRAGQIVSAKTRHSTRTAPTGIALNNKPDTKQEYQDSRVDKKVLLLIQRTVLKSDRTEA